MRGESPPIPSLVTPAPHPVPLPAAGLVNEPAELATRGEGTAKRRWCLSVQKHEPIERFQSSRRGNLQHRNCKAKVKIDVPWGVASVAAVSRPRCVGDRRPLGKSRSHHDRGLETAATAHREGPRHLGGYGLAVTSHRCERRQIKDQLSSPTLPPRRRREFRGSAYAVRGST